MPEKLRAERLIYKNQRSSKLSSVTAELLSLELEKLQSLKAKNHAKGQSLPVLCKNRLKSSKCFKSSTEAISEN